MTKDFTRLRYLWSHFTPSGVDMAWFRNSLDYTGVEGFNDLYMLSRDAGMLADKVASTIYPFDKFRMSMEDVTRKLASFTMAFAPEFKIEEKKIGRNYIFSGKYNITDIKEENEKDLYQEALDYHLGFQRVALLAKTHNYFSFQAGIDLNREELNIPYMNPGFDNLEKIIIPPVLSDLPVLEKYSGTFLAAFLAIIEDNKAKSSPGLANASPVLKALILDTMYKSTVTSFISDWGGMQSQAKKIVSAILEFGENHGHELGYVDKTTYLSFWKRTQENLNAYGEFSDKQNEVKGVFEKFSRKYVNKGYDVFIDAMRKSIPQLHEGMLEVMASAKYDDRRPSVPIKIANTVLRQATYSILDFRDNTVIAHFQSYFDKTFTKHKGG